MRQRGQPVHRPDRPFPQVDPVIVPAGRRHLVRQGHGLPGPGRRCAGAGRHWTVTLVITFPVASSTWTPHAMQGSNEWIVRRISSGWSGLSSG